MWDKLLEAGAAIWDEHTGPALPFDAVEALPCRCAGELAGRACLAYRCERCGATGHRFTVFEGSRAAHERCDGCFGLHAAEVEQLTSWREMAAEAASESADSGESDLWDR